MMPSSFLLFHQMSMTVPDYVQIRELKKDVEFWNTYWQELIKSAAKHMGMTYQEFHGMIDNTWMLTAFQAKQKGLIDGFITDYQCDTQDKYCINPLYSFF